MVYRENNPRKSISSYWLLVYPNQLIRLRKEKRIASPQITAHSFFKRNGVNGNHLIFQPDFPVFQCIWKAFQDLLRSTELWWYICIIAMHGCVNLCWRKLVLFIYREVCYLKNKLIHKCIIYFSLRTSSAFKGVARSHARAARERRRFAAGARVLSLRSP